MRNRQMDISKGIGIILVVIGHSGFPFTNIIYLFHMALFFFISGYFYCGQCNPKKYLVKRLKSLYLPFIAWGGIYIIFHNFFVRIGLINATLYSLYELLKRLIVLLTFSMNEELLGTFWFFIVLFSMNILFYIVDKATSIMGIGVFGQIIICFIFSAVGNYFNKYQIELPRLLDTTCTLMIIFAGGVGYRKYENIYCNIIKVNSQCIILFVSIVYLWIMNEFGEVNLDRNSYPNLLFLLSCSAAGISIVLIISKWLNHRKWGNILSYIGRRSMIIMVLHVSAFKILTTIFVCFTAIGKEGLGETPLPISLERWWFAFAIIGVSIPLALEFVKIRIVKSFARYFKKLPISKVDK